MVADLNDPAHPGHSNHLIATDGKIPVRVWAPDIPILESVKNELLTIAQTFCEEKCGFIDSEWTVHKVFNSHEEPHRNFYMSEADTVPVLDHIYTVRQEHVIAQWHTHPNDVVWPSPRDIIGWPHLGLGWRYLIVTQNEIIEWELK